MSILNVHPVQNAAPLFQLSPHTLQQTCAILSLYIVRSFFCPSLPLCSGPLRWCSDGETWSGFHASFCENNGQTADEEQPDPPLPQKRWLLGVCLRARPCARVNNSKGERQKCWDKQIHGQFRFYLNIWAFPTKQPLGQTATHSDSEHSQNPSTPWK